MDVYAMNFIDKHNCNACRGIERFCKLHQKMEDMSRSQNASFATRPTPVEAKKRVIPHLKRFNFGRVLSREDLTND